MYEHEQLLSIDYGSTIDSLTNDLTNDNKTSSFNFNIFLN